ncbi:twin-arginine translocation signal domain-containing protein [Gemmatimonas sp.]
MTTARRDFLKHAGLGASALVALPGSAMAASASLRKISPPDNAARRALQRLNAADQADQQAITWDTSWMQRVRGKHRAMFDVPLVELGYPILRSGIWVEQVQEVFKVPTNEISAVIVIRHDAIPLLMNHEYWSRYNAGEQFKVKDEDGAPLTFNPVLTPPAGKQGSGPPRLALDKQIERGAIVLGCNLAFGDVIEGIQRKDTVSVAEARTIAMRHVIPGVIMQPSGIFANVAAQQTGCLFVEASL